MCQMNKSLDNMEEVIKHTEVIATKEQFLSHYDHYLAYGGMLHDHLITVIFKGNKEEAIKWLSKERGVTAIHINATLHRYKERKELKLANDHKLKIAKDNAQIKLDKLAKDSREAKRLKEELSSKSTLRTETNLKIDNLSDWETRGLGGTTTIMTEKLDIINIIPHGATAQQIKLVRELYSTYPQLKKWTRFEALSIAKHGGMRDYVCKEVLALVDPTTAEVQQTKQTVTALERAETAEANKRANKTADGNSSLAYSDTVEGKAEKVARDQQQKQQKQEQQEAIQSNTTNSYSLPTEKLVFERTKTQKLSAKDKILVTKTLLALGLTIADIKQYTKETSK